MRISRTVKYISFYCFVALLALAAIGALTGIYNSPAEAMERSKSAPLGSSTSGTFSNTTAIPIADSNGFPDVGVGNPYPSVINVSGLTGNITDVNVTLAGVTHTWPNDLAFLLVSPGGQYMVLQSDEGGDIGITGVTYTLDDQGSGEIPYPIVAGTYFPSSVGDDDIFPITGSDPPISDCFNTPCPQPQPAGSATLNDTFGGHSPNGDWKLYAVDCCGGDTGSVTGGWSVTITTAATAKPNVDMNGDGASDFVILQDTTPALSSSGAPMRAKSFRERIARMEALKEGGSTASTAGSPDNVAWWVSNSGGGTVNTTVFGNTATDFPTPADFDGDGLDDFAFWRTGGPDEAAFYIFQSSTSTVRTELFGQALDDPGVVGDYDGDGIDDPAVFRCPESVAGQCYFYYRGSNNNPNGDITYVPWGYGTINNVFADPGDFDGDGKYDFNVQTNTALALSPEGNVPGIFYLLRSGDLGFEAIYWGFDTDLVVPGDYDGDGKDDICVVRNNGGQLTWYILERDGGTQWLDWGLSTDWITPGDYDGDGKADLAVWRPGTGNDDNYFYVYQSGTSSLNTFEWGTPNDVPAAFWNVH